MNQYSDLDYAKLHFQELYAEAERYRLIKNSKQFEPASQIRWYARLFEHLHAWIVRWRCIFQGRLSQNLVPGLNNLVLDPAPWTCAPEPCME